MASHVKLGNVRQTRGSLGFGPRRQRRLPGRGTRGRKTGPGSDAPSAGLDALGTRIAEKKRVFRRAPPSRRSRLRRSRALRGETRSWSVMALERVRRGDRGSESAFASERKVVKSFLTSSSVSCITSSTDAKGPVPFEHRELLGVVPRSDFSPRRKQRATAERGAVNPGDQESRFHSDTRGDVMR